MNVEQSLAVDKYRSVWEYFEDQQLILDVILEEAIRQMPVHSVNLAHMNKMALTEEEAKEVLHSQVVHLKLSDQYEEVIQRLEDITTEKINHSPHLSISCLKSRFDLDELDFRVMTLMLAPHLNKKYTKLYAYLQDDMTKQYITLDLLIALCARTTEDIQALYERYYYLDGKYAMLYEEGEKQALLFQESTILIKPLRLKERTIHFLLLHKEGSYRFPFDIKSSVYAGDELTQIELILNQDMQKDINQLARKYEQQPIMLCFTGPSGSGKLLHTKHLAASMQKGVLCVDAASLPAHRSDFKQGLATLLFDAVLTNRIVVFDRIERLLIASDARFEWLQQEIQAYTGIICFHSEQEFILSLEKHSVFYFSLNVPSIDERFKLWLYFASARLSINTSQALELANKFQFTPGQIETSIQRTELTIIQSNETEVAEQMKLLHEAAYSIIHHGLDEKASKLKVGWTWDDLILPSDVMQLLQQACFRINHRYTVMQDWGFSRLLPYGRGVSMLFTGPPGTGKTMAASVMAKQLQCELYRVDLTRIVSKYIGETEKNLAEVFDRAKLSGAILFFDEADALFGKRSEVKDSHDKYANMETSYLLQKMEEYEGLTILATNFSQNLDEAFIRRIQYIVKFPFPTVDQREQLWRSVIPKQMPCEELDYSFLAKTFELSGGPIKNIVLTAAYMAASDNGTVSMKHIVEAAIQEYKKTGKLLMKERLGNYSEFWKG